MVTPLEVAGYSSNTAKRVWLKREDLQTTGSFKIRGATAKLASLGRDELSRGVVAASTGNHGLAVAHAAREFDTTATVYVPESAKRAKVDKIRALGGSVVTVPGNAIASELEGRREARSTGAAYIPPYNDPDVVAGQGTIGLELLDQIDPPFTVVVSVGGGGLVSGIAATLHGTGCTIVGTSPEVDAAMATSVGAGRIVEVEAGPTLSDGTAGNIEHDSLTLALCMELVDRWVLQPEEAIAEALVAHETATGVRVEGSAALALATARSLHVDGDVVVVICGGNV